MDEFLEQDDTQELEKKAKAARREKEIISFVTSFKKNSLEFYKDKFARFSHFDRLYIKGAASSNTPVGKANLALPLAFQQIEPFVCQMAETMVGEAPYLAYAGRGEEDDANALKITDYAQYLLDNGEFLVPYTSYLRNLAKYGTAIEKINWETETDQIENTVLVQQPVMNPDGTPAVDQMGMPVMESVEQTTIEDVKIFDGLKFYNISIFDFFVSPSATSCDVQKTDIVYRTWRTAEELYQNPNYKNKEKIKEIIKKRKTDKNTSESAGTLDQEKRNELDNYTDSSQDKFKGLFETLEYWGRFDLEDSEDSMSEQCLIVVALIDKEEVLLRADKNPLKYKFKPFIASNDYPIEGEFYGYGELNHIDGLIKEVTALRNARLDISNMGLNPMWLADRMSGINFRELVATPQKIIFANGVDGLRRLEIGGNTGPSTQEIGQAGFDIQNTTEIINPRQDVSNVGSAFGGTATGVNFLSARSNLRLLLKARIQEKQFFRPLALMILRYCRQMVTDESYFRVMNDPENPYTQQTGPETFNSDVDYKPSSNPSKLTNDEKKNDMGYLLQNVIQVEKTNPGINNFKELLPAIYKLSNFPHPKKFINDMPTTVMQTPDGQLVDRAGQPVQVTPIDEKGNPLPPPDQMGGGMPGGDMPPDGMM